MCRRSSINHNHNSSRSSYYCHQAGKIQVKDIVGEPGGSDRRRDGMTSSFPFKL